MKSKKKVIKKNKLETAKYLSKLNNIQKTPDNNIFIIQSLQQIIRFFNDYLIDLVDSDIDYQILQIFNQKVLDTRYHLYNLVYYDDSYNIIKEQIENILEYFFPKNSNEYFLLKKKIISDGYYMHKNIGINYFLSEL